jgi:hypothetical protein
MQDLYIHMHQTTKKWNPRTKKWTKSLGIVVVNVFIKVPFKGDRDLKQKKV